MVDGLKWCQMDLLEYAVFIAHHAFDVHDVKLDHFKEKFSHFTPKQMEELSFGDGTVDTILKLPGAERRRIFVFQSNARLSNAMQIIQQYERILVQHVVKPFSRVFAGRLIARASGFVETK